MWEKAHSLKDEQTEVYLTVLTNEKYICGVKALKRSLRSVKSKHDLVILVPQSKEEILRLSLEKSRILDKNCKVCVKADVDVEYSEDMKFKEHYWSNTFFKLSAAICLEYKKVILLDSDMIILHNIDHLFHKPHYSATIAGQCANPQWDTLNSGLMVIEPSIELYCRLMDNIKPAMYRCFHKGYNFGDQDVFVEAFKDWGKHTELKLSEIYNCFFEYVRILANKEQIRLRDISVVHFIGRIKPWSNGCFTKSNIRMCLSLVKERKFYELNIYIKYLWFASL